MGIKPSLIFCSLLIVSFYSSAKNIFDPLSKCYAITNSDTREKIQACLRDELALSEQQLNVIFEKSKSDLEDNDALMKRKAIDTLINAQNSFIKFRHSECQRQSALLMGSIATADYFIACEVKLNLWRAKALLNNE